ncbi:hypothetical protein D3C76_504190 [compost metagenome]
MIKFEFSISDELRETYDREIVSRTKQRMADFIVAMPAPHKESFKFYFDETKINRILNCEPNELIFYIDEVYRTLPILADRYWPSLLLTGVPIPENIKEFGARTPKEKETIETTLQTVKVFLQGLASDDKYYLSWLLNKLELATTSSAKRKALESILTASHGNTRATEDYLNIFPKWVNDFSEIFNYSELSAKIGHKIVDEWQIDVCLYCNQEPIQTQGKLVKYRTDLDHFYPRTKFPFLAVTLSNLIPSGKICNQSYKRNQDMIDYSHPFVDGVSESRLFYLDIPPGEKITENNFHVKITKQNSSLDLNLSGFEIEHNYGNSNELKSWVSNAYGMIEIILSLNEPLMQEKLLDSLVNTKKPAHNERQKKFKADSINQFANRQLVHYP